MNNIKKYIKEIVFFTILLLLISNGVSYLKSLDLNKESFSQTSFTLLDNEHYFIKNKPLLVHFWATWCPICKLEAPNIEKLSKDYEVITIAVQSGTEYAIKEYIQEKNLSFRVVNDFDGSLAKQFNVEVYPTTLIYNSKKELVFSDVGYTSTLGLYLRMFLVESWFD